MLYTPAASAGLGGGSGSQRHSRREARGRRADTYPIAQPRGHLACQLVSPQFEQRGCCECAAGCPRHGKAARQLIPAQGHVSSMRKCSISKFLFQ